MAWSGEHCTRRNVQIRIGRKRTGTRTYRTPSSWSKVQILPGTTSSITVRRSPPRGYSGSTCQKLYTPSLTRCCCCALSALSIPSTSRLAPVVVAPTSVPVPPTPRSSSDQHIADSTAASIELIPPSRPPPLRASPPARARTPRRGRAPPRPPTAAPRVHTGNPPAAAARAARAERLSRIPIRVCHNLRFSNFYIRPSMRVRCAHRRASRLLAGPIRARATRPLSLVRLVSQF